MVEDFDEDEDEEEVVVFGDGGCAAMQAGAAFVGRGGLCCGHCGEDGGHVLRPLVGGGWLEGPGRDLAALRAHPVGSGGRGICGAAVSAFRAQLGRAPAMREGVWVNVCAGEHFAWAAFGGRG